MSTKFLDELHKWKQKNPGLPRRVTFSEPAWDQFRREADLNYAQCGRDGIETYISIPVERDTQQTEEMVLHT